MINIDFDYLIDHNPELLMCVVSANASALVWGLETVYLTIRTMCRLLQL